MENISEISDVRSESVLPLGAMQKVHYHQKANVLLFSIKGEFKTLNNYNISENMSALKPHILAAEYSTFILHLQ